MLILCGDAVCISTETPCCRPATFLILYHLPAPSLWAAHPLPLLHPQLFKGATGAFFATGELHLCGLSLIGRADLRARECSTSTVSLLQAVPALMRYPLDSVPVENAERLRRKRLRTLLRATDNPHH